MERRASGSYLSRRISGEAKSELVNETTKKWRDDKSKKISFEIVYFFVVRFKVALRNYIINMVRYRSKRKRGSRADSSANDSIGISTTTAETTATAVRIGNDSPIDDDIFCIDRAEVCTLRDSEEPRSRQSSLLSFFAKENKAKSWQKAKHGVGDLNARSGGRMTKINGILSSSPLPRSSCSPLSTPLHHRSTEELPTNELATAPLFHHPPPQTHPRKKKSLTQVYIDCGQSKFGQILCNKCGMLYMPGILEDEKQHDRLCQAYSQGIPCGRGNVKGGKQLDFAANKTGTNQKDEAIVVVRRPNVKVKTSKKTKNKEVEIKSSGISDKHRPSQWPLLAQMISKDLGTDEKTTLDHLTNEIVFLYIGKNRSNGIEHSAGANTTNATNRSRILGVATVQLLGKVHAYRMINLYERSLTPVKDAKMGIGLLWTHPIARRKGIATLLIHAAREHAVFGIRVSRQDLAFSNPTKAGYNFAFRYSGCYKNTGARIGVSNESHNDDTDDIGNNKEGLICSKSKQQKIRSLLSGRTGPLVYEMNL